jgi:hypothetical protein
MILTPSSSSSAIAGFSFWALAWATLGHLDTIPVVGRFINKEKVYTYVNKNKATTLIGTEIVNFSIHGISNPLAVTMAVGGSILNIGCIYGWIPLRQKRKERKEAGHLILGV